MPKNVKNKYTLINCYSDNNKGDLGIILSTIELLKEVDSMADVVCMSTFNRSDPLFAKEHNILKKYSSLIPAIFGELNIFSSKSPLSKLIKMCFDTTRLLIYMLTPISIIRVVRILFSKDELIAIDRIIESDKIISKGGSFLCDEKDFRSKLAFFRFLFIFFICLKHSKKIVILAQSLGPVNSKINRLMLNFLLMRCEHIVLREKACLQEYSYLRVPSDTKFINDIAYFLKSKKSDDFILFDHSDRIRVGMTIKHVEASLDEKYIEMMRSAIEYFISRYNAIIHIFPHVTIEDDLGNAFNVLKKVDDRYKSSIHIYSGDYDPSELKALYSKMDYFIGTRLHSTIFAMGALVPSICISYHGTKSIGIFSNFDLDEFVILNYSGESLINKIDAIIKNRQEVIKKISLRLEKDRNDFIKFLSELIL